MRTHRLLRAELVLAIAASMVACAPKGEPTLSPSPDPVEELADQLGNADIVQEVFVRSDFGDDPTIDVTLKSGAGAAQARDLVCTVVRPAILSGRIPPSLAPNLGVAIWDSAGRRLLAVESDCR